MVLGVRRDRGHFNYYTGPKSHYPEKTIDSCPLPTSKSNKWKKVAELNSEDIQRLRDFAISYGKSVRQHTVRDKSKEESGCLPYAVSLNVNRQDDGAIEWKHQHYLVTTLTS